MTTWKIEQLERNTFDGFVTTAHWRATKTDNGFCASTYGSCKFEGKLNTPYEELTESKVLAWVWSKVPKTQVESQLIQQIADQKTPATLSGVPWQVD